VKYLLIRRPRVGAERPSQTIRAQEDYLFWARSGRASSAQRKPGQAEFVTVKSGVARVPQGLRTRARQLSSDRLRFPAELGRGPPN
jgi:hypothetical protein